MTEEESQKLREEICDKVNGGHVYEVTGSLPWVCTFCGAKSVAPKSPT